MPERVPCSPGFIKRRIKRSHRTVDLKKKNNSVVGDGIKRKEEAVLARKEPFFILSVNERKKTYKDHNAA